MSTTSRGPSRRTLVKGAAWSVPVVAIAGAAPAMAASLPFEIQWGAACKLPGNSGYVRKGYRFHVCFVNTQATDYTVTITGFTVNGVAATEWWPGVIEVAANSSTCLDIDAGPYDDSANGQACMYLDWENTRGQTGEGSSCTMVNDLPPCDDRTDPGEDTKSTDVKVDEAPASTDAETAEPAPAPAAPVESTPAPAPADDASTTSAP